MQSNLSFAKAFKDAEAPLLPLTPRRLNNQTAVFPSPMIGGPLRSSVPPESINGDVRESSVFENGTREKNNAPRTQNPATSIAISILKNELAECGESAHFMDLASKVIGFLEDPVVSCTNRCDTTDEQERHGQIFL